MHASGKSTVGKMLETEGYKYLPEIAYEIMEDTEYEPGKDSDCSFQREVFYREKRRDNEVLDDNIIIETWHTGNLAHAKEVADTKLIRKEKNYLEKLIEEEDLSIKAFYLDIPFEKIIERSNIYNEERKEVESFYRKIERNIYQIYESMNIDYRIVDNENNSPEETKQYIENIIRSSS